MVLKVVTGKILETLELWWYSTPAFRFGTAVILGWAFGFRMIDQAELRKAAPAVKLSKIK